MINILRPQIDEARVFIHIERINIPKDNIVPIDIARLDIVEERQSPIMLQRIAPDSRLEPISLLADDYVIWLSISSGGKVIGEANCRLWIDSGTLRLTKLPNPPKDSPTQSGLTR